MTIVKITQKGRRMLKGFNEQERMVVLLDDKQEEQAIRRASSKVRTYAMSADESSCGPDPQCVAVRFSVSRLAQTHALLKGSARAVLLDGKSPGQSTLQIWSGLVRSSVFDAEEKTSARSTRLGQRRRISKEMDLLRLMGVAAHSARWQLALHADPDARIASE